MSDTPTAKKGERDLKFTDLLAALNHIGQKLKVTIDGGALVVDCADAMETPNDVRCWYLTTDGDGTWRHGPSATSGPLYEMLRGIAASYTVAVGTARAGATEAAR